MELAYGFLAKFVDLTPEGVFSAIGGGFDTLHTSDLPITIPSAAVFARILTGPGEWGREHRVRLQLVDPDGEKLPVDIDFPFTPTQHSGAEHRAKGVNFGVNIVNIVLPKPGKYEFRVLVDNERIGAVAFFVRRKAEQ
jgi:hypothetical protein